MRANIFYLRSTYGEAGPFWPGYKTLEIENLPANGRTNSEWADDDPIITELAQHIGDTYHNGARVIIQSIVKLK